MLSIIRDFFEEIVEDLFPGENPPLWKKAALIAFVALLPIIGSIDSINF